MAVELGFESLQTIRNMEIRRDFRDVETYLYRLLEIAKAFDQYEDGRWVHLKNREDFSKVYALENPARREFENLYADGRTIAGFMRSRLREFNSAQSYPTFSSFVDSFETTWVNEIDEQRARIELVKSISEKLEYRSPWSVRQMIEVFEDQLHLLAAVRATLEILKKTPLYRTDKGDHVMDSEKSHAGVTIGVVNAERLYVQSTDNSTNLKAESSEVFKQLRRLLDSIAENSENEKLSKDIQAMESTVGTPTFTQHYKNFIQNASNHVTVFTPIFPALAQLLS